MKHLFGGLFDTARATTHLGIASTPEGQIDAEDRLVARWNKAAKGAGWDVRLERFGPNLPAILYNWDGREFSEAPSGAAYVQERWRKLGLEPPPLIKLHLHHEWAKRRGELVPTRQGPIISKAVDTGWALEYRPVGGIEFVTVNLDTIKLKRGTWLSDTFVFLWSQGESPLVNPRTFRAEASRDWWQRLRKNKFGRFWQRFDTGPEPESPAIIAWRIRWSLYDAQPLNAYRRPFRPSFWNVRDYSHPVLLRWKNGTAAWADGQYGKPAYPKPNQLWCDTAASAYLALWPQLKPPAEQRRLEDCKRLYRAGWRDLARRDHFSVWIDKNAQRADGRKVRKRGNGPLTVVERLNEWQRHDDEARRKDENWEVKTTRQLNATSAFLHDWLRRYPETTQVRNNLVKNMEQDFSETKDYRQAKTCPRCRTVFYKPPGATIHCASECPKLTEAMVNGKLERVA